MLTALPRIVLCVIGFVLVLVAPAYAGGPTSAILSVPGEGKTASIYYTDPEYDQLGQLLGTTNGTGVSGKVDNSGQGHESGPGVTVTWLIHDVDPWRIDRIFINAEGGPWVSTQVMTGGSGSIWDSPVVWHQPTSGKELAMLLDELGVGDAGLPESAAPAAVVPPAEEPATPEPATGSSTVSGMWWGLGGLVGGALLALGWMRLRPNREEEPDLDPDADWLAPQTRSTSAYAAPPARRA